MKSSSLMLKIAALGNALVLTAAFVVFPACKHHVMPPTIAPPPPHFERFMPPTIMPPPVDSQRFIPPTISPPPADFRRVLPPGQEYPPEKKNELPR